MVHAAAPRVVAHRGIPQPRTHAEDCPLAILLERYGNDADGEAATLFVRRTRPPLTRLLTAISGEAGAEDLVQETYARAFETLRDRPGGLPTQVWLTTLARQVAEQYRRRAWTRPCIHPQLTAEGFDPARHSDHGEVIALWSALGDLGHDQYRALVLTRIVGLTYLEAARICACPVGTIRSRVARAREALSAHLANTSPAPPLSDDEHAALPLHTLPI